MELIKSFVFFDLETTGLPYNGGATRITEISLVAARREQIIERHEGIVKENNFEDSYLPRVLNKINLTVYPCKMIHPSASAISGLTNEDLVQQPPFDENMFSILQLFMDRLEKPVCLVAHNGFKFDFPIFKSELTRIGKEFSGDVFCVDSYPGFREVLTPRCEDENSVDRDIRPLEAPLNRDMRPLDNHANRAIRPLEEPVNRAIDLVPKCGFSQEDYDLEMAKTLEISERIVQEHGSFNVQEIQMKIQSEMEKWRKTNETTPVRRPRQHVAYPTCDHVRRKILSETRKQKPKFSLSAVYERVVKKSLVNAHRAESDALALLECVTVIGLPILEWMDGNKIPFRNVRKMW